MPAGYGWFETSLSRPSGPLKDAYAVGHEKGELYFCFLSISLSFFREAGIFERTPNFRDRPSRKEKWTPAVSGLKRHFGDLPRNSRTHCAIGRE